MCLNVNRCTFHVPGVLFAILESTIFTALENISLKKSVKLMPTKINVFFTDWPIHPKVKTKIKSNINHFPYLIGFQYAYRVF